MDISLNLARVGNWTADNYQEKKSLINRFLIQTDGYLQDLLKDPKSNDMKTVLISFEKEFRKLRNDVTHKFDEDEWAERALTWANILQHRAKLA